MNGFGKISLAVLVVLATCQVYADVETTTKCSLSFYRYLFNLPGEQIRPNVPEGTYVFGKRVGPPNQEGQASNVQPSVLRPAPSYEAPNYLPPPSTTTTTTTTPRPSTSAPTYVPPPSPYYPAEASNPVHSVVVLPEAKPTCDHPEHQKPVSLDSNLLPPYRFEPSPKYQPQPTFLAPKFVPQPTFLAPKFVPLPQTSVKTPVVSVRENEIFTSPSSQKPAFRYPVPTPPPQFLRPYVQSSTAPPTPPPPPAPVAHENCENHRRPPAPIVTFAPPSPPPSTTPEAPVVETRQSEIVIIPEPASPSPPPQSKAVDCGHKHHNVVVESLGVPSTDYGVVSPSAPAPSAGYSYDRPQVPFVSPADSNVNGYAYPKPSPSFEYPGGYAAQGTSLFESEAPKTSDDGDLVILKV